MDGSQKTYFVTLYEGRIIQVIDSIFEKSLKNNEDAIAITKDGNILYYIEKENFFRELQLSKDPFFIVKRYFEQWDGVHQLSQRLQHFQDEEATRLENARLDTSSSGEPISEHDTILRGFQKRAIALKNRVTSS